MRDVVKTNVKREQNSKRARRRKKNIPLYIFLILIAVLGIGVLLSVTLLFGVEKINVKGDIDYSNESVIKASGIEKGDNLVRLDAEAAEKKILSSMIYIEEADISKKYPDTLEINLKKCTPSANVEYDGGYLIISPKGKILENEKEPQGSLPMVKGLEPVSLNEGEYIKSSDEEKAKIFLEIIETLSKGENKVTSIDMSDIYSILVVYDNRITFELGNSNDISYKLKLADTVLRDISDDKKGTMIMVGANQISFRSESGGANDKKGSSVVKVPVDSKDLPEGYTNPVSRQDSDDSEDDYGQDYDENSYYDDGYGDYYEDYEYGDYGEEDAGYGGEYSEYYAE